MAKRRREDRVIAAIDLDCFYAQVATTLDKSLKGKPVAIQQKYIIVTCNYEARRMGVKKMANLEAVKRDFPQLIIVDGSDLTPFRKASAQIFACVSKYKIPVERVGMDEVFLDLTERVDDRIQAATSISRIGFEGFVSGDPEKEDPEVARRMAVGTHVCKEIRQAIMDELGYTCCGGVSYGKHSAKLAAELHKPNSQSCILPYSFPDHVVPLPVRVLQGIGRKVAAEMLEEFKKIEPLTTCTMLSCGDARRLPKDSVLRACKQSKLKADFVYNSVRGLDLGELRPSQTMFKTMSQEETTLPHPRTWSEACDRLLVLSKRIHAMVIERYNRTSEVPLTVKLTVYNKAIKEHLGQSRSMRGQRTLSKQKKVAGSAFADEMSLFSEVVPVMKALIGDKFHLGRVNLAVTDFTTTSLKNPFASDQTLRFKPAVAPKVNHLVDPSDIDPSVLSELPAEIREQIEKEMAAITAPKKKRKKASTTIDSFFQRSNSKANANK